MHLAPDRQPHQHPTAVFTGQMPFLPPNQQRQSTIQGHGTHILTHPHLTALYQSTEGIQSTEGMGMVL